MERQEGQSAKGPKVSAAVVSKWFTVPGRASGREAQGGILLLVGFRFRHGLAGCEVDHEPCLLRMAGWDIGLAGPKFAEDLLRAGKALSACGGDRFPVG